MVSDLAVTKVLNDGKLFLSVQRSKALEMDNFTKRKWKECRFLRKFETVNVPCLGMSSLSKQSKFI